MKETISSSSWFIARVVELCLAAAAKRDPSNLALHFYKNGENPDDSAGMAAFHARSVCYSQVILAHLARFGSFFDVPIR